VQQITNFQNFDNDTVDKNWNSNSTFDKFNNDLAMSLIKSADESRYVDDIKKIKFHMNEIMKHNEWDNKSCQVSIVVVQQCKNG
jgi:hypothetical protein